MQKKKKYSELDCIRGAVSKINADHLRLQRSYDASLNYSQENFLKSVIYHVHVAEDVNQNLKSLSLIDYADGGCLAMLSFAGVSKIEEHLTESIRLGLRSQFLTKIQNHYAEISFIIVPIDYKKFCLIFESHIKENVFVFLQSMIEKLEQELPIDLTFSIAKPVYRVEAFHEAFKEACFLNDNRYKYLNTKIITSESEMVISDKTYIYPLETERLLIEAIRNHEFEKSRKILAEVLNKNLCELDLDGYSVVRFKYALFNTIKRILNMNNKSIVGFFTANPQLLEELESDKTKKIYVAFETAFEYILKSLNMEEQSVTTNAMRILDYIHKNFTEDLSLTIVADECSLSEGYVSKILKEATNIKFKTYLGRLKIEKAKELLKEKKYKISEVSEMVGYRNVNTFIRVFKDFEGISPGAYKKMHL